MLVMLTGASGGIGSAIARRLAKGGVDLLLVGRDESKLQQVAAGIDGTGVDCVLADFGTVEGRGKIALTLADSSRPVEALINCAGINHFGLFESMTDEQISQQFSVNVVAPLQLTKVYLQYASGKGFAAQVINVGSAFGSIGYPGFAAYSGAKFALRGATEALAREYADTGIRVRYFAPRATKTDMNTNAVNEMNEALGVAMDSPEVVAEAFWKFFSGSAPRAFVGFPEKLFVRVNAILPKVVTNAIVKQLADIKRFARQAS